LFVVPLASLKSAPRKRLISEAIGNIIWDRSKVFHHKYEYDVQPVNASLKVHHDVSAKVHQFKTYF
jgi:hypothetical protein